ncbi:PFL_4669 family integrating conjugative element protein [Hydrogenophaga atypica]|uniref:PFL_4669 family integrating conjugative element protein n=1 Tax=Hydrogenophaga atypica TaxID=249409 RepID=A0ABW2QQH5_9BURK
MPSTKTKKQPDAATVVPPVSAVPASLLLKPVVAPAGRMKFETEKNSPFADGYSIAKEEAFLADFLAGDMDESDPLYDRYVELDERKNQLEKLRAQHRTHRGADKIVDHAEARGLDELGALVDEEADQMSIHTKEAYRMFMGRAKEPGTNNPAIIGGKRVAAALKALWDATGNDNPYADWALLRHEQTIKEVQRRLRRELQAAEKELVEQQSRGIKLSVLRSENPKVLNLGFKSPYGFAVASLIAEFDYYVRVQKTLARKNIRSDEQVRQAITELTRFVRRVFNETARFDRWLMRAEMKGLCRADFIPDAAADSKARVEFAVGVFGMVPSEIYSTKLQPRHSRRRLQITPAERSLLQTVGAALAKQEGLQADEAVATVSGEGAALLSEQETAAGVA